MEITKWTACRGKKRLTLLITLLLGLICSASGNTLQIYAENDYFQSDRHYTHGTRITLEHPVEGYDPIDRLSLSIGQHMYTPGDISVEELLEGDRPYGGWLYLGIQARDLRERSIQSLELDIGIIGEWSLADETQTWVHKQIGSQKPMGWDNQLKNELGVMLIGKHVHKLYSSENLKFYPHAGFALGNVFTYANTGFELRAGYNTPEESMGNIEPTAIRNKENDKLMAFIILGVDGRAVLRNIFLDGNTFANSHHVDKRPFVGDFKTGICVGYGRVSLRFLHVIRSKEFYGQDQHNEFDSLSLSVGF